MYWLNNVLIPPATELKPGYRRVGRFGRTSSARMVGDVVAIKRAMSLEYNVLPEPDLGQLLNLLESRFFHAFRHPDPQSATGERTTQVYVGDIDAGGWYRDLTGVRCWKDITIGLIEQ